MDGAQAADLQGVLPELEAPLRLAAAYAPAPARAPWAALLALDQRLSRVALAAREPMLAQLRLAWWRDRFRESPAHWPKGEPLLALLRAWAAEAPALEALVDGWERAIGEPASADLAALADARVGAIRALARLVVARDDPARIEMAARQWATQSGGPALRLSRAMRPLAILVALADDDARGLRGWLRLVRLGMVGR